VLINLVDQKKEVCVREKREEILKEGRDPLPMATT